MALATEGICRTLCAYLNTAHLFFFSGSHHNRVSDVIVALPLPSIVVAVEYNLRG